MKKSIKIGLSVFILIALLGAAIIFVFSNIEIKTSLNTQKTSEEQIVDEDIISFLKENNIINSSDIYTDYDRDIGLWGPEGNKKYIYERNNKTYYYVGIRPLTYTSNGEYMGYNYNANEVFYLIHIQDCEYNPVAKYMDERILEVYGELSYYIVSGAKNNFKLISVTP